MSAFGWVVVLSTLLLVKALTFDSMAHMRNLVIFEKDLVERLNSYIQDHEDVLERVKEFAEIIHNGTKVVANQGNSYLDSPINAYAIIKRFTDGWSRLGSIVQLGEQYKDLKEKVEKSNATIPANNNKDFQGAITAILRLQNTYNLTARSIVHGRIPACQPTTPLTAEDCFEFGAGAYKSYQFRRAREWLQEGVRLIKQQRSDEGSRVSLKNLLEYLAWVEYLTGNIKKALELTTVLIRIAPDEIRFQNNEKNYRLILNNKTPLTKAQSGAAQEYNQTETFMNSIYAKLCQGKTIKVKKNHNRLKCWYHRRRDPRLLLKPAKLELINLKPKIYMYRNFISNREAKKIKELATPLLNRATVFNPTTKVLEHADYRVAKSAWLEESKDAVVSQVNRRAALFTGLDKGCTEHLQVGNYGMGGQYETHVDFGDPGTPISKDAKLGNRIATLLIYLNDVASGGATIFNVAGVTISPSKGDAAFWYNLKRSGEGDYSTSHAGCPVLCGNKWVANKWFRERDNLFNRPCALNVNV